jgi:hypothetical protein
MRDSGRAQLGVRWAGEILFKSSAPGLWTVIFVLSELGKTLKFRYSLLP